MKTATKPMARRKRAPAPPIQPYLASVRYERVVSVRIADDTFEAMRVIAAQRRLKPAELYRMACEELVKRDALATR